MMGLRRRHGLAFQEHQSHHISHYFRNIIVSCMFRQFQQKLNKNIVKTHRIGYQPLVFVFLLPFSEATSHVVFRIFQGNSHCITPKYPFFSKPIYNQYFYSPNRLSLYLMQRHIERNLRRDIKHIVNMQGLLQQYDRENKYLNKQVLDLINENTRLRMDKVKANIINDVLNLDKKKMKTPTKKSGHELSGKKCESTAKSGRAEQSNEKKMFQTSGKMQRSSSKKLLQKFKLDTETEPVKINVVKKDECVQTQTLQKTQQTAQTQPNRQHTPKNRVIVPIQQKPFSFRHPTPNDHAPFESQSASSQQFVSQIDLKFTESPKEIPQNQTSQSRILNLSRETIALPLAQNQSITMLHSNQTTIKRESIMAQHLKRSHAIRPSPHVDTSLCKNKQNMTPSSSQQKLLNRQDSRGKIRPFQSVQKKKRFLQVVSISQTPKVAKGQGDDCC